MMASVLFGRCLYKSESHYITEKQLKGMRRVMYVAVGGRDGLAVAAAPEHVSALAAADSFMFACVLLCLRHCAATRSLFVRFSPHVADVAAPSCDISPLPKAGLRQQCAELARAGLDLQTLSGCPYPVSNTFSKQVEGCTPCKYRSTRRASSSPPRRGMIMISSPARPTPKTSRRKSGQALRKQFRTRCTAWSSTARPLPPCPSKRARRSGAAARIVCIFPSG